MIKFLISIFVICFVYSCKQIQDNKISTKVNSGITTIEKVLLKKEENNQSKLKKEIKKNDKVFYYLEEPYYIEGVKYTPEENYNYSEIGISTYYGKELHNVKTINNDVNKVTELIGRHKTLPIPSMVKITNLDNGLSINIKVVDRHRDNTSLIQVSRKVAQLLGFYKDKIATVKVQILSDSSKQWKNVLNSLNEPKFEETVSSAPTDIVSISDIEENDLKSENNITNIVEPVELNSEEVNDFNLFLKVFKFSSYLELKSTMQNSPYEYQYISENTGSFYNVLVGPVDKTNMNNLVSYFISKGYKETKIILE